MNAGEHNQDTGWKTRPAIPMIGNIMRRSRTLGLWIAILIITLWSFSLIFLLPLKLTQVSWPWLILAILVRTFLQTGLFILAHDAIHGSLVRSSTLINHRLGKVAVWLYACLPYDRCSTNHWKHHRYPNQIGDPDFHDGIHAHPIRWYFKFLSQYLTAHQMLLLLSWWGFIFIGLHQTLGLSPNNFLLFWILPLVLSSIQLFYFGTYLPHRGKEADSSQEVYSSPYPIWLSFLTCYHFGYHWEHHQFPNIPWYQLPSIRFGQQLRSSVSNF